MTASRPQVLPLLAAFVLLAVPAAAQPFQASLVVSDGVQETVLVFGVDREATDGFDQGLDQPAPPPPLENAFDARLRTAAEDFFTDIRSDELTEKNFLLVYQPSSMGTEITFSWNAADLADGWIVELVDGDVVVDLFAASSHTASELTGSVEIRVSPVNFPPGVPVILTPEDGAVFLIGGATREEALPAGTELLTVEWTAVEDPDGDPVVYTVEVSADEDFASLLIAFEAAASTSVSLTVGEAAALFDAAHGTAALGAEIAVHVRVTSYDGALVAAGDPIALTLRRGTVTSLESAEMPIEWAVSANYPEPVRARTTIELGLPWAASVQVRVYDVAGRVVLQTDVRHLVPAASHLLELDASGLGSGVYFYEVVVTTPDSRRRAVKKMVVVR